MKSILLKAAPLMLTAFFLFSCQGSNGDQKQSTAEKSAKTANAAQRHAVIKLIMADGLDSTMTNAVIFYDSMNKETMVAGGTGADKKDLFNLTFAGKEMGVLKDAYLTLRGYKVVKVSGALMRADDNVISGMIQGIARKKDKNGFPLEGDITFKATFQK